MDTYRKILKYRSHLMGMAILWVVFFHMKVTLPTKLIEFVWKIGYGGVDIFFFLSGIGVYYSLKKNTVEEFYLRRLKRIMPAYLPIVFVVFILYNIQQWRGVSFSIIINWMKQLIGNVFMIGWINQVDGQFNWYVQAVMWFYLLAPLLVHLIRKVSVNKGRMLCFWSVLFLMQIPFFGNSIHKMPARLLVYALGMYVAWRYEEGTEEKDNTIMLYLLATVGMGGLYFIYAYVPDWLSMYGLYWFPFVLIVPGLCVLLSNGMDALNKYKVTTLLANGVARLGEASFEIYLIHIVLFEFVLNSIEWKGNIKWLLAAIASVIAGILYKKVIIGITKKLRLV